MKKILAMLLSFLIIGMFVSCTKENTLFDRICTADEGLKSSKKGSVVVFEDLKCTAGDEIWDEFYETVSRGESASVLCAHYYTLNKDSVSEELYEVEKDLYPMLFFYTLEYDGDTFTVTVRQSTEEEPESSEQFQHLMHYTGKTYNRFLYDYYVLVDDPTVTWEQIEAGIVSSQPGTGARHSRVYTNIFDDYPIYDALIFDIDGDGKDERCVLGYGMTSGLFTFTFSASEIGAEQPKYNNAFWTDWYDLSFIRCDDGVVRVQGIDQKEIPQTHLFDIAIVDGNVHLTEDGQDIGKEFQP